MNKEEIKQIQEQFNKIITYSQDIEEPQTDELFDKWFKAKTRFIKAFDNKLIYEYPTKVSFQLSETEKHKALRHFLDRLIIDYNAIELATFIAEQQDGFFKNITIKPYITDNKVTIKEGFKLVKAFKYFISDPKILTDIQNSASRVIQEDKIEGRLCFSVHPLDFLSVSENSFKWRSCHALDGEYRAGNLSYMMDECTFICYLKADSNYKLPNFPDDILWNSKKWRVLFYLSQDENMLFAGKQYPFSSDSGMNFILDTFFKNEWSKWTDYKIRNIDYNDDLHISYEEPCIPLFDSIKCVSDFVVDIPGSKHFNDVLHSSCYDPIYIFKTRENWYGKKTIKANSYSTIFNIGGFTKCLRCGKEETLEASDSMMCYDCEIQYGKRNTRSYVNCKDCGQRIHIEEAFLSPEEEEEEYYCHHCFHKEYFICDICNETFSKDNLGYSDYYTKCCKNCHIIDEEEED